MENKTFNIGIGTRIEVLDNRTTASNTIVEGEVIKINESVVGEPVLTLDTGYEIFLR